MRLSSRSRSSSSSNRVRREREGYYTEDSPLAPSTTDDLDVGDSSTSAGSTTTLTTIPEAVVEATPSYSHLHAQEGIHQQQMDHVEMEEEEQEPQQQCLEYLGDSAESSPQHLCGLRSPGQLLERLQTLRLRNCCERSVFSALHTLALNASLTDRTECLRILNDLLDVDGLANRITCELAEILFRFDCRQVYSLINQCDDCKVSSLQKNKISNPPSHKVQITKQLQDRMERNVKFHQKWQLIPRTSWPLNPTNPLTSQQSP